MISLITLSMYPVKSMKGLTSSSLAVTKQGVTGDRLFMLTDLAGTFISARTHPQLVRFGAVYTDNTLTLTAPEGEQLTVLLTDFSTKPTPTQVWHDRFMAYRCCAVVNRWLSRHINDNVQLCWSGKQSTRIYRHAPATSLRFTDSAPILLINHASLLSLKAHCPAPIDARQFRANLIINGAKAFAEHYWKTIQIGSLIFDVIKPCTRCSLITVDPLTGLPHPDNEPFKTLQYIQQAAPFDVHFGCYLMARQAGVLQLGAPLNVLESAPPNNTSSPVPSPIAMKDDTAETVTITYQGITFDGNTTQVVLEQLEQQQLPVPYSCRAGSCGSCQLQLVAGEIEYLARPDKRKNTGTILACIAVPKTDIALRNVKSSTHSPLDD